MGQFSVEICHLVGQFSMKLNRKTGTTDYFDLLQQTPTSMSSLADLSVLVVPSQFFIFATDAQITQMINFVDQNHIALATYGEQMWNGPSSVSFLTRIASLGGDLKYFIMDGAYDGGLQQGLSLSTIAGTVANDVSAIKELYPNIQIGDAEPIPDPGNIQGWLSAYASATGAPLGFLAADVQWNQNWQPALEQAADEIRSDGVGFDVFYTGDPATTDASWSALIDQRWMEVESDPLIRPDAGIIASWENYPTSLLPQSDPSTLSNALLNYEQIAPLLRDGVLSPIEYPAPSLGVTQEVFAEVGEAATIPGVSLTVDDSVPSNVTLAMLVTATYGTLGVQQVTGPSVTGSGTSTLLIVGNATQINYEMSTLAVDEPSPGSDSILFTAYDGSGSASQGSAAIEAFYSGSESNESMLTGIQVSSQDGQPQMNFISASTNINVASAASQVFIPLGGSAWSATIEGFDPKEDIIALPKLGAAGNDNLTLSNTGSGALAMFGNDQTILLSGIGKNLLGSSNFQFV